MDIMTTLRSQPDRSAAVAAGVAGAVALFLGWFGVSGTAYPAEQLPYLVSGGLGGLFLLGMSTALWLSADLHDEWRKLDRIEQAIRASGAGEAPAEPTRQESETDDELPTRRLPELATEGGP